MKNNDFNPYEQKKGTDKKYEVIEIIRQIESNLLKGREEEESVELIMDYAKKKCVEQREICANQCIGLWTESELVDRVREAPAPNFE